MPEILAAAHDGATALQSLYYAGGALGFVGGLTAIALKIRPVLRRRVHRWDRLDQLLGDPDGNPARPGVLERVEELTGQVTAQHQALADLQKLALELVPNHGSSYRDEYRRDRDHQQQVNAAMAAALNIVLPASPHHQG